MVNSVLKNDLAADIDFEDVSEDDWFCDDVRKGVALVLFQLQHVVFRTGE